MCLGQGTRSREKEVLINLRIVILSHKTWMREDLHVSRRLVDAFKALTADTASRRSPFVERVSVPLAERLVFPTIYAEVRLSRTAPKKSWVRELECPPSCLVNI